jgi:hypothetical protein
MIPMWKVPVIIDRLRDGPKELRQPPYKNSFGLLSAVRPWVTNGQYKRFAAEVRGYGSERISQVIKEVEARYDWMRPGSQDDVSAIRSRMP